MTWPRRLIDRGPFFAGYRTAFRKLSQGQVDGLELLLGFIEADPEITDVRWAAYMLATVKHECADTWRPIEERGPRKYFDKYEPGTEIGRRLGNTQKGDGYLFRGRGYVQLTGRRNSKEMTIRLGLPTERNLTLYPEWALDPDIAYRIMSYGMRNGSFTGKALDDYITGKECDYVRARKIINALDKSDLIAGYAVSLEKILQASLGEEG
jgi:putative chitinase